MDDVRPRMTTLPKFFFALPEIAPFLGEDLPVLMYHKVSDLPPQVHKPLRGLYVSPQVFQKQVTEFSRAGFRAVGIDATLSKQSHQREVVFTFDDGFESVFLNALPALTNARFTSINYLVADLLGKTNVWDAAFPETPQRLMDAAQVRDWLAAGQKIGAHTLSHPKLTQLSDADARREIGDSKKKLEDLFSIEVTDFCYPYGDHDERIVALVAEAGYRTACSMRHGLHHSGDSPLRVRRMLARHASRSPRALLRAWRARLAYHFSTHA